MTTVLESSLMRVLALVDRIEELGVSEVIQKGLLREYSVDDALRVIGDNAALADTMNNQISSVIIETFLQSSVAVFEAECCSDRDGHDLSAAIDSLSADFDQASMLLRHCAELLKDECTNSVCTKFATSVRCTLLEESLLSQTPTKKCTRLLMRFLHQHGTRLLEVLEADPASGTAAIERDGTLQALHRLGLATTAWVHDEWRSLLRSAIDRHLAVFEDDDGTVPRVQECKKWKEVVIDPFIRAALGGGTCGLFQSGSQEIAGFGDSDVRQEMDRWSTELWQYMLSSLFTKRLERFWDLLVDYPASIPALQDMRYCLTHSSNRKLQLELTLHAKKMLASRLHRAGTSTENILNVLVATIRTLCVVVHKNEQSSGVLAVVGDTLKHLRERKDSVAAVVKDITQQDTDNSVLYSDLRTAQANQDGQSDDDSDGEGDHSTSQPATGQSGRRPDVLRVLLSTLSAHTIIDEFRSVLAQRLLTKGASFDTIDEEEILERIRCVFGDDLLSACTVMVRDVQASRRLHQRLLERGASRDAPSVPKVSATILSATCWPQQRTLSLLTTGVPSNTTFEPHPLLHEQMEQYSAQFRLHKPNQRVVWLPELGRVTIRVPQRCNQSQQQVLVEHELSFLVASAALYLRGGGVMSIDELAAKLKCDTSACLQRLTPHHPVTFIVRTDTRVVQLQPSIVTASTFTFEDEPTSNGPANAGLAPEDLDRLLNSVTAMLKSRGSASSNRTAPEIYNSLKMFGLYTGPLQDLKKVLQYMVQEGKLVTLDGTAYSLPRP